MWMDLDELQTYLIGLKCYTTGTWPYFGPDVNGAESSFQSQIPGALEGLLIGLPFYVLPIPEAPFLLLNLMSSLGVVLLAWYLNRRLPSLPFLWICLWVAVAPWSIQEATRVINPSYTFLPSVLFFIGFMESVPLFRLGAVAQPLANALMGFSLFWIMQFHFSYVYLLPLAAFALGARLWKGRDPRCLLYFVLGSLPPLAFVLPTYVQYGLARNNVASGFTVPFNWNNVREFWTITARFFSLVSFEMPRFIGTDTQDRLQFLGRHPFLYPPGAFLWIAGLLQPFLLVAAWFRELRGLSQRYFGAGFLALTAFLVLGGGPRRLSLLGMSVGIAGITYLLGLWMDRLSFKPSGPQWREINLSLLALFAMVEVSFWFTIKMPLSHIYFVLFPFLMAYSCQVWMGFAGSRAWRGLAKFFVVCAVLFQLGYAVAVQPQYSIYKDRARVVRALQEKNYHLMGERRPGSLY